MSLLGPVGACSYGTTNLNTAETETVGFSLRPVWDAAGRTITYVIHKFVIKSVVYSNIAPIDDTIAFLRVALMQPCQPFIWQDKGGGAVRANVPGETTFDVNYGPKPISLRFFNIHEFAARFEFEIEVALPYMCLFPSFGGDDIPMELNFGLDFDIDESGWTKRNYHGHMIIAVTRDGGATDRTLTDNVDNYRDQIVPAPLQGFRRVSSSFRLNDAKTRMEFAIADIEMGVNIPPIGIIDVKASHHQGSQSGIGLVKWTGRIAANYELQKGTDPQEAYNHFISLVNQRLRLLRADPRTRTSDDKPGSPMVVGFTAEEPDLFGKTQCNFAVNYFFFCSIAEFVCTGLWTGVPVSNWAQWSASLFAFDSGGRGIAKLGFKDDDEIIVDLCLTVPPDPLQEDDVSPGLAAQETPEEVLFQKPNPESSYFHYESAISLRTPDSTIVQKPLAMMPIPAPTGPDGINDEEDDTNEYVPPPIDPILPPSVVQQRSAPTIRVVLSGSALRAAYPISPPAVVSIGGIPCVKANDPDDDFYQKKIENIGFPLYYAEWSQTYLLASQPTEIVPPPNPMFDADEGTSPNSSNLLLPNSPRPGISSLFSGSPG